MGLGYAFDHLIKGDFAGAFNGVWVSDDLLAAQDAETSNLARIIQEDQAKGLVSETESQNLYSQMVPNTDSATYWAQSGNTPLQEFDVAVKENAANIGQLGSKAINKVAGLGFSLIPWQVYVLLLILVMVWAYPFWKPFAASLMAGKK
jgi:hypothetical protein